MISDYSVLVQSVEIKELALLEMKSWRNTEKIPMGMEVNTELSTSDPVWLSDDEFGIEAVFDLSAKTKESPNSEISIWMKWRIAYKVVNAPPRGVDASLLADFGSRNVPINLWPYIRETVAAMTTRMSIPVMVLPTLKIIR